MTDYYGTDVSEQCAQSIRRAAAGFGIDAWPNGDGTFALWNGSGLVESRVPADQLETRLVLAMREVNRAQLLPDQHGLDGLARDAM